MDLGRAEIVDLHAFLSAYLVVVPSKVIHRKVYIKYSYKPRKTSNKNIQKDTWPHKQLTIFVIIS